MRSAFEVGRACGRLGGNYGRLPVWGCSGFRGLRGSDHELVLPSESGYVVVLLGVQGFGCSPVFGMSFARLSFQVVIYQLSGSQKAA